MTNIMSGKKKYMSLKCNKMAEFSLNAKQNLGKLLLSEWKYSKFFIFYDDNKKDQLC